MTFEYETPHDPSDLPHAEIVHDGTVIGQIHGLQYINGPNNNHATISIRASSPAVSTLERYQHNHTFFDIEVTHQPHPGDIRRLTLEACHIDRKTPIPHTITDMPTVEFDLEIGNVIHTPAP